jgi:hypothetical protein
MTQPQVVELWPLRLHREMLGAVAAALTLPLHRVKDTPGCRAGDDSSTKAASLRRNTLT